MTGKTKAASIGRLQSAARMSRTALAERLVGHGFYAGQDQIMLELGREDGQAPGQLASRIGVRPPTITKAINRLQSQGFVEKRPTSADGRQARVFLTEAGHTALTAIAKSIRKTEKQAFKGLDKKELKSLSKVLSRIEENLSGSQLATQQGSGAAE